MRGLVPRWGGGGAWQNPRCQFAVPSHNSSFSYLGVPAPAGMSDYYESMSRTTIRDSLPTRHSGESRSPGGGGGGTNGPNNLPSFSYLGIPDCRPRVNGGREYAAPRRECSAGACPPLGRRRGVAESAVPIRRTKPQLQLFIPWCAGACRHERLLRKHVPDHDPG